MCRLQWSLLPLLILLLFRSPDMMQAQSFSQQKIYAEALLEFKSAVGDPLTLRNWLGEDPCSKPWIGVKCAGLLQNSTVISLKLTGYGLDGFISPALQNLTSLVTLWLDDNHLRGSIPPELGNLKNLTSLRLSNNVLNGSIPSSLALLPKLKELTLMNNHLRGSLPFEGAFSRVMDILVDGNNELCSPTGGLNLSACGPSPTLTFTPHQVPDGDKSGKSKIPAIVGGAAAAVVLVGITIGFVCFCLMRAKSFSSRTSETGSSEPSALAEWGKPSESPRAGVSISLSEAQRARQYTLSELEQATKQFSQNNLIGEGGFGLVYKGLLQEGTIVAIKRRTSSPSQDFVNEVRYLSCIRHRHLVSLLGYCQESDQQMLVYDYLPNGSVCNHLYDSDGNSVGKLDFRQRLSVAVGAAKGLEHLHGLTPPLVHKDFKTCNVLVDENFIAKVTDFGLSRLLAGAYDAGPSSPIDGFLDPEFQVSRRLNEKSDVYSFGVFLLELISGREAIRLNCPGEEQHLINWPSCRVEIHGVIDNPTTKIHGVDGNLSQAKFLRGSKELVSIIDTRLGDNFTEEAMREFIELAFWCLESPGEIRPTMNEVMKELDQLLEKERGLTATIGEGTAIVPGSELFT